MKKKIAIIFLLFFPFLTFAASYQNEESSQALLKEISKGISRVAKKAIPSVVYIETQVDKRSFTLEGKKGPDNSFEQFQDEFFNRFFGLQEEKKRKSDVIRGSGFFVSSEGHILTNYHVVDHGTKIQVTLHGGKKVKATITGTDPKTDLAVIKIEEVSFSTPLQFGNSDKLEVGDLVMAVGNPFGLQETVTFGIVSAKGRDQLHINDSEDFIQTDAAINPGNSGGPLLNIEGDVIGINTAIVSGSGGYMGIGFAIPSKMASLVVDQLIKEGSVTRGFLGVTLQPIDEELAKYYDLKDLQGALVTEVLKDSPADKAGLRQEDVILEFNSISVKTLSNFRNAVSLMAPGSKLILRVLREGKIKELTITISSIPTDPPSVASLSIEKLGVQVQNLSAEIVEQLNYPHKEGVVVTQVVPGGPAEFAGIRAGSVIVAVNRQKVANVKEFNTLLSQANHDDILLMVKQGETIRFIVLQMQSKNE